MLEISSIIFDCLMPQACANIAGCCLAKSMQIGHSPSK